MQSHHRIFWKGITHSLPFIAVVVPFGFLFGVIATEAGLNIVQTMSFSLVVVAGAAQFTALTLLMDNAPTVVAILTALAVNLRMAMYSAALAPHLGPAPLWKRALVAYGLVDQAFILSDTAYQKHTDWSVDEKLAYYAGSTVLIIVLWMIVTYAGGMVGTALPEWLALDFALPMTFVAMIAPGLRTPAHMVAAGVSVLGALTFAFVPYGLGLLLAALCAMAAGAEVERRMMQR
ncbi:MAG: AzlC family ABC transporter permease [Pseudomonadota bacterium]